jgi:hypothetical protein
MLFKKPGASIQSIRSCHAQTNGANLNHSTMLLSIIMQNLRSTPALLVALLAVSFPVFSKPPEPPKFFSLSVDVELEGSVQRVEHSWRCEQRWNWAGQLWDWTMVDPKPIVKQLNEHSAAMLSFPLGYCYGGNADFRPDVALFRDLNDLSQLEIYPGNQTQLYGESQVVKQGSVRQEDHDVPLGRATLPEQRLREYWRSHRLDYVAIAGIVVPEEIWRRSPQLESQLTHLTEVTKADELPTNSKQTKHFPGTIGITDDMKRLLKVINMVKMEDTWVADGKGPRDVIFFRLRPETGPRNQINKDIWASYAGKRFNIYGPNQEIYDPTERVLIRFASMTPRSF